MFRHFSLATMLVISISINPLGAVAGTWQSSPVRELWAFKGGQADSILFNVITGMAHWRQDTILVADGGNNSIYILSVQTGEISVFARSGEGPGEVDIPYFLSHTPDGGIVTYSVGRMSLEKFDKDGVFVSRTFLRSGIVSNPKGLAMLADGSFVLSGGIIGNPLGVHQYGPQGRLLRSWAPNVETENPAASVYMAGGAVWPLASGGFIYSNASPHRIIEYDSDFQETLLAADSAILENPGDDFARVNEINGQQRVTFRWWYPQSRGVFKLSDGSVINVITRFYEGDSIWERFGPNGELLHRAVVPVAYRPWDLTSERSILASYRDPVTGEHIAVELHVSATFLGANRTSTQDHPFSSY